MKTDYAKKGFVFGWSEESGKYGLLSNIPSDITQEDFALKMYKVNKSNKYLDEDNLIDALTYFSADMIYCKMWKRILKQ